MKKAGDRPAFFFNYSAESRRQRVSSACASWPSSSARSCGRSCGPCSSCGPGSCGPSYGQLPFSVPSFWLPSSRSIQEWISHLSTGGPASYSECNFERCTITRSCERHARTRDRREYRNCRVNHAIVNVRRELQTNFGDSVSTAASRVFVRRRDVSCTRVCCLSGDRRDAFFMRGDARVARATYHKPDTVT